MVSKKSNKKKKSSKTKKKSSKKKSNLYPGTSEERRNIIINNIKNMDNSEFENIKYWEELRKKLVKAGGLKDDNYDTMHIFSDFNHCDLTPIKKSYYCNENNGQVEGIHYSNSLCSVIKNNSLSLESKNKKGKKIINNDGSWGTCMIGCDKNPPQDVAHLQFKCKIAFKLIWLPGKNGLFENFVLVGDDGKILKKGNNLDIVYPPFDQRKMNYEVVKNSKQFMKYIKKIN